MTMDDGQMSLPVWQPAGFDAGRLSADEAAVYRALLSHVGLARAIKVADLAALVWPLDDFDRSRRLRHIVRELTEAHGLAIGASVRAPFGVYLIDCREDLDIYAGNLFSRAMAVLARYGKLKRLHAAELAGQIRIQLEAAKR